MTYTGRIAAIRSLPLKIPLVQIATTPRHIDFSERFQDPDSEAVRFVSPVRVRATYYRSGSDLFRAL